MRVFGTILFLICFIGIPVSFLSIIVFLIKRKKIKKALLSLGICLLGFVVSAFLVHSTYTEEELAEIEQNRIEQEAQKAEEEEAKRLEEEARKAEEEAKKEAERIAKEEEADKKAEEESQKAEEEAKKAEEAERLEEERKAEEERKQAEEESKALEEEKSRKFEYDDMVVEYLEYKIEDNAAGEECLVLYFDFTNNTDENQTFLYAFSVNAFQNGVALDSSLMHVNEETKNHSREIQPETTIKVANAFLLSESTSPVDIEVEPWISFSEEKLMEFTVEIK